MKPLLHPQLTYAVRGVLFDVRQQLDLTLPEKYYQEAIAIGLENAGIPCQTEKQFDVTYRGVQVGRYASIRRPSSPALGRPSIFPNHPEWLMIIDVIGPS